MTEPDVTDASDGATSAENPPPSGRRRTLPVGPLGLFLITAVALLAAGAVLWFGTRSDSKAVKVTDALDDLQVTALVPDGTDPVRVGDAAPDVRLDMLDGTRQSLSELRGKPVVLNFWSSTCAPCLKEMPDLQRVSTDHAAKVAVIGVDVTDTANAGKDMVAKTGVTYPNARDPQAEIFAAFGGTALPRTVLIDAKGKVVEVHNGALTSDQLTEMLQTNHLLS
ncbi:MAG: TlpA family protein disulfide reductase [Actinobacteria bacterium]|nr:TlpA family protein disulfide reductase [Actinomycetota bacterium]